MPPDAFGSCFLAEQNPILAYTFPVPQVSDSSFVMLEGNVLALRS